MISILVLVLTLGSNSLVAVESTKIHDINYTQNIGLSQNDMEFLFASNNVNAMILSDEEMEATQGEGFFAALGMGILIGGLQWGYNCAVKGKCKDWKVNIRL